ncbi:MAG: enoyl-CoA hydratase/isomerase family protein [Ignavibacteria bacterium]|nr:enoyl-CoA hydratase/isomerase family protein [Ignavibacteria bacterium]MBT8390899.1 enoyl-CoA hydratase/isomerase family protein [Ignavibacteria bacterium]
MKEPVKLEFENNEFKCHLDEQIAIVKVKCNAFYSLTDLDVSRRILQWFDIVSEEENIKAILLLNEKGCYGNTAYEVFLTSITGKDHSKTEHDRLSPQERSQIRTREVNVLNSFIMATVNYRKFVVSGLNGTIVTPFFGASLASNFRFISEDSVLSLNHAKYGLHAGGALPFFLPKFIGPGKAAEYVFNGGEISAKEALEIGLINKILSEENFDETCVNETKILCQYDSRYIRWTKDLLTTYKTELIDYLHKEEKFIEHY